MIDKLTIESPLPVILSEKIKFHEQQRAYHSDQIEYIKKILGEAPTEVDNQDLIKNEPSVESDPLKRPWHWEANVLSYVEKYFPEGKFRTGQLVDKVLKGLDLQFDEEGRKEVMYAASTGLRKININKKINREKPLGMKGYLYYL